LVFNENNEANLDDNKKEEIIKILFKYGANIPPELLHKILNDEENSDYIKKLVKNLSKPESIQKRDEDLLKDEALIKVYKNLILNGKLTLDPKIPDYDIINQVIVKAIESITTEESAEIKKTNPEKFAEIQKFISQAKDPKSGEKRPHTDFSALRGNEVDSPEHSKGESSTKKPKTQEAGAEIGGVDRAPSPSISRQKRGREGGESPTTQLAAGDPTKRSKTDGGAGGGDGGFGGAGRGAGGGVGGGSRA
jgi:hypothetical protein